MREIAQCFQSMEGDPNPLRPFGARIAMGIFGTVLALSGLAPGRAAQTGSWQTVGSMAAGRHGGTATLLADGTVLVTGGEGYQEGKYVDLASAEIFDPKTSRFSLTSSMHGGRQFHRAVRLQDGRVLVLGGFGGDGHATASAEVFDPTTATFSRVGDMTVPRTLMTATLLRDGRVLVAGGGDDVTQTYYASAELFDPATGRFQTTGSMAVARVDHTAVLMADGRVAFIGGDDGNQALRQIEVYDPSSGQFLSGGESLEARSSPSATLLAQGKILLAAGNQFDAIGQVVEVNSAEIYDPATQQSILAGNLLAPLGGDHAAVALEDGRILLAGGWAKANPPVASGMAQLYDPAAGQLTLAAPMSSRRGEPTAVLLTDGRALVLGGLPTTGYPLASAEAYTP